MAEVLELRQYTLHPGRRDELIDLFDRELVEPQEAVGAQVLGQFRDRDDDDRFVWLRGFADMATRGEALAAFYGGPVWRAHGDKANATMIDSDDVLLLRPVADLDLAGRTRGGPTTPGDGHALPPATRRRGRVPGLLRLGRGADADGDRARHRWPCCAPCARRTTSRALPFREDANVVAWVGVVPRPGRAGRARPAARPRDPLDPRHAADAHQAAVPSAGAAPAGADDTFTAALRSSGNDNRHSCATLRAVQRQEVAP